jgi:hypothetical protein
MVQVIILIGIDTNEFIYLIILCFHNFTLTVITQRKIILFEKGRIEYIKNGVIFEEFKKLPYPGHKDKNLS